MDNIIHNLNLTARCQSYYPLSAYDYVDLVIIALSVSTFIFSLISWKRIKDFRSFKNYLFIYIIVNIILNAAFRNLNIECIADKFNDPTTVLAVILVEDGLRNYFGLTVNYWLMLLFYDTYLNVVKIYNNHIVRRYLKANVWGWGVPFIICLFIYFIIPALVPASGSIIIFIQIFSMLVPLVFNGIIYLIIFFSLLTTKTVSTIVEKKCRFLRMLSFLFVICILSFVTNIMPWSYTDKFSLQLVKLMFSLKDFTVILYFLTSKHNMSLWQEYYGKVQSKRLLNTYF